MQIAFLVFFPLLCGPVAYFAGRRSERFRDWLILICTALCMALSLSLTLHAWRGEVAALTVPYVFVNGLSFTATGFRALYSLITSLMWLFTALFSREYFLHEREGLNAYWMFTLMTLGATQGVMLSADFMTTFVFFEVLSLTSFTWVMHEQTAEALRAGYTYLFVAVFGGLVLLMGLFLLYNACGTLEYAALREAVGDADSKRVFAASVCILFGFGAKAGMFPLHIWLPMAHPVAPSPASALLSGVLTKVGVYGILMTTLELMPGNRVFGLLVLTLALVTMFLGALLALFSVNLKRTLACSSMSQIGFILTGLASATLCGVQTGAGTLSGAGVTLALSGTVLHMLNHSLFKLLLFMAAGVALMNLHALSLDDIRGWGRNKTALKVAFAVGGLGISGVPLLNGYLSKSMLHEGLVHLAESAAETGFWTGPTLWYFHAAEWIFLISGGFTFAYMLKLFVCVFVERNANPAKQARYDASPDCMDALSTAVITLSALLLVPLGQPWIVTHIAKFAVDSFGVTEEALHFEAFAWENLKGALISLSIGAAAYLAFVRPVLRPRGTYVNRWPAALNLEARLYTPLFTNWLPTLFGNITRLFAENVLTRRVCQGLLFAASVLARAMNDSADALIVLSRRTFAREVKIHDERTAVRIGRFRAFRRATSAALDAFNFSFALLMTCLGVILILGFLLILIFL